MAIGTILDCSTDVEERLPTILAAQQIRVRRVGESLTFQRWIGRIDCLPRQRNGRTLLWLTVPKAHAFNPFFWYFDFALSKRIERVLRGNGASVSDWETFAEED
jgi:hypothetical protein